MRWIWFQLNLAKCKCSVPDEHKLHKITKINGAGVAANAAASGLATQEQVGGGNAFTVTFEMTTGNFEPHAAGAHATCTPHNDDATTCNSTEWSTGIGQ